MKKYLIKFAWKCNHERFGEIISFVVSPYQETSPNSYGYVLDNTSDEVIRFPSSSLEANSLLRRLAGMGNNQWAAPSFDLVEKEFDLDEFEEDLYYQDNYGRNVLFHTHEDCY